MSLFRVVYSQRGHNDRPSADIEATEFIECAPWIVFLDPSGTCFTVRTEDVDRIDRLQLAPPPSEPPVSLPSDPPIPGIATGSPAALPWLWAHNR